MSRRLVITADDVGLDEPTVTAVAELARAGRLTAVSVIPMAGWAFQALEVLRPSAGGRSPMAGPYLNPGLSIGLHATFTSDLSRGSWGPWSPGASLVRPGGRRFYTNVVDFAAAAHPQDVLAELRAQIAWLRDSGVGPSHLDSHHGAIYGLVGPDFVQVALTVCAENGLALRLPRRLPWAMGEVSPAVRLTHERGIAAADELGVQLPETIVTEWRPGAVLSGYADLRDSYLAMLRQLPDGLSEVFLHPARPPAPGTRCSSALAKRTWEYRLLQDDAFGATLAAEGIEVVSWPGSLIPVNA